MLNSDQSIFVIIVYLQGPVTGKFDEYEMDNN